MSLRRVAVGCILLALLGLAGLLLLGLGAWRDISRHQDEFQRLRGVRAEATRLGLAVDYAVLLRKATKPDPGIQAHARWLASELNGLPDGAATIALGHLEEVAFFASRLDAQAQASSGRQPDPTRAIAMARQMRIHHHGLVEALDQLVRSRQEQMTDALARTATSAALGLAGLALLYLLAFLYVYRRLSRPMARIQEGIRELSEGNEASRIGLAGHDELSDVAHALDGLADSLQAERIALRRSEDRFHLIAQATSDALWDWDLRSGEVWWSDGMRDQFGYDDAQLRPDSPAWAERIHPDERQRVTASLSEALRSGARDWSKSYRFLRTDGSYAHVVDRGTIFRDASGAPLRMVGGITDVSERVALEEQLRQSQRMESIGQLTGGIAHDFNNLLTVIQGNAELLGDRLADRPELMALARMVERAGQRGAELTHRLLAFARRQSLDPRPTDFRQLVDDMLPLLRRSLGASIDIETRHASDLWASQVDPAQLESALLNLCINARDAMSAGGWLVIETRNVPAGEHPAPDEDSAQDSVLLQVSDTGCGIPADKLPHIFEPFFTTKETGKGTGLGLAMVYGFVTQSKGRIEVDSEPGKGTTFRLFLPRAAAALRTQTPQPRPARGGGETILLVEDDELVRQFARGQLESLGYRVLSAASAVEALSTLRENTDVALLFTDVMMPGGMDGRELARKAREIRPNLPVLYTSGYAADVLQKEGRLDPGVRLLGKPYPLAELSRQLRDALG